MKIGSFFRIQNNQKVFISFLFVIKTNKLKNAKESLLILKFVVAENSKELEEEINGKLQRYHNFQ
jgi:hypothetical protein